MVVIEDLFFFFFFLFIRFGFNLKEYIYIRFSKSYIKLRFIC